MLPTRIEVEQTARQAIERMTVFARTRFGIPDLQFGLRFNTRERGVSRAVFVKQRYFISLAHYELYSFPVLGFKEYASLARSPNTGSFDTTDWKIHLEALVAHEMAHIVQFWLKRKADHKADGGTASEPYIKGLGYYEGGHGRFFQTIYRVFRDEFVNHLLTEDERYAMPQKEFVKPELDQDSISEQVCPLAGVQFTINNRLFEVVGYNADTKKRLYRYRATEMATGTIYSVQIKDIINLCVDGKAKAILDRNPALQAEFLDFKEKKQKVRNAVTKRRSYGW